jgi:transposase InsO family protein
VWAFPLTGKSVAATTRALEKLLEECKQKPRLISNDSGPEFQGSFDALLKQRGIKHINGIPGRPESNGVVERVNGTLKKLILRNKAYKGLGWSDHLEEAVDNYNNLPHGTVGISPAEAIALPVAQQGELATQHKTQKRNYKADTVRKLQVGDKVRLKVNKSRLEHYAVANWSEQVYVISKVSVPRRPFESISYHVAGKPQSYVYEDLLKIP